MKVGLMNQFQNFDCNLKYRLFDNDNAIDYDQKFDSIYNVYKVRQEYDLRLFCTWTNLGELFISIIFKLNS